MSTALATTVSDAHLTMAQNSKSFALAARVFTPATRDAAAVVYAYCRYVDDAIDSVTGPAQQVALAGLRTELAQVYAGNADARLAPLAQVVQTYNIPVHYFSELLRGMQLDTDGQRYRTTADLVDYCYCVASVVGLIMCHIMGVRRTTVVAEQLTLARAAHLGIAMQLTNICRDVLEDHQRSRCYLPDDLLLAHNVDAQRMHATAALQPADAQQLRPVVAALLQLADRYYRSGQRGTLALPLRSAFAVRAARRIYAAIGTQLAAMHYDVLAGRAVVSKARKLGHVAIAAMQTAAELPQRFWYWIRRQGFAAPTQQLEAANVTQPK